MNKRKPLTRFLSSPYLGLSWHLRIVTMPPEDHRPFWQQKLKQKAVAVARQEHKLATAPPDQARPCRKYLYLLRKELAAQYGELLDHRRSMDAKSATKTFQGIT
jgi:hypothetical protein